jgi:hypothetical protein
LGLLAETRANLTAEAQKAGLSDGDLASPKSFDAIVARRLLAGLPEMDLDAISAMHRRCKQIETAISLAAAKLDQARETARRDYQSAAEASLQPTHLAVVKAWLDLLRACKAHRSACDTVLGAGFSTGSRYHTHGGWSAQNLADSKPRIEALIRDGIIARADVADLLS